MFSYIILPNGKIVNWNNNLYYGNSHIQVATNSQISNLQNQINPIKNTVDNLTNNPSLYFKSGTIGQPISGTIQTSYSQNTLYIPCNIPSLKNILMISLKVYNSRVTVSASTSSWSSSWAARVTININNTFDSLSGSYQNLHLQNNISSATGTFNGTSSYTYFSGSQNNTINWLGDSSDINNMSTLYGLPLSVFMTNIYPPPTNVTVSGNINIQYTALCYA